MNVTVTIDELDMGGAQHIVHELARRLDRSKYKITIICTDGKTDSILERQMIEEQKNGDYSLVFMKKPLFLYINTPSKIFNRFLRRLFRFPSDLLTIPSLCREIKKTKPDIVHAHQHGILAGYWTLFHRIPMIATVHTSPAVTFYRESEKIIFKALVFYKRIVVVGISKYNSELIKKYSHGKLKKEAQKLGIAEFLEFTGYVKSTIEYLALCDVYVSSSRREGLSLSALEAMASGLPVIATDAGGIRDLARDNGILVADDDEDGLYAAMKKLRDNRELRLAMGRKSLEMVQSYSASEMAAKYAALYEEFAIKQSL